MTWKRLAALSGFLGLTLLAICVTPIAAEPAQPAPPDQGVDNETCLSCHGAPG